MLHKRLRWALKKHKEGDLSTKNRAGRPRILTNRDESFIERVVCKDPFITSSQISEEIINNYKKKVSSATIRRILKKRNLKSYVAKKKPLLTKKMSKKRLAWCKKYVNKPKEFWENILFTDESSISINLDSLLYKCRRFPWYSLVF